MKIVKKVFNKMKTIFQFYSEKKKQKRFELCKKRETEYNKILQSKNKNQNPSIISNNCVGGVIYHNLGLEFLSPTINLVVIDYLPFIKNLDYYLNRPLVEKKNENAKFPVGEIISDNELPNIVIHFIHYKSFEQAHDKWKERSKRINYDNLFFIWEIYDYAYNDDEAIEFDNLPIKKLLIVHSQKNNLKNAVTVDCYKKDNPSGAILKFKGLSGKRNLEKIDYISFLNQ